MGCGKRRILALACESLSRVVVSATGGILWHWSRSKQRLQPDTAIVSVAATNWLACEMKRLGRAIAHAAAKSIWN